MTEAQKPGAGHPGLRLHAWLLIAVIGLGFLLRVANLADTSHSPFFTRPVIDGQVYDEWAMAIKAGQAPAGPFYQDPLYPYFLALIYELFGHSYWAVYIIQLLLGTFLLWLIYDTTRMLCDRRAGIAAALLGALCKPFIFYEGQIEKTALAVFLVGLLVWAFVKAFTARRREGRGSGIGIPTPEPRHPRPDTRGTVALLRPSAGSFTARTGKAMVNHQSSIFNLQSLWALLAGLALGLAALTRANILLFAPLLPLLFLFAPAKGDGLLRRPSLEHRRLVPAMAALAGILVVIAPVVVRNSVAGHELILTTTQGGQNLYIGNSEYNLTGQYAAPPWVRPNPEFEQADFHEYARKAAGKELSPAAVSGFYTHAALQWIGRYPGRALSLFVRKLALYFNNHEIPDNQDMYFFSRYSWILRLPLLGFGIIFGLGLAGMILLRGWPVPRVSLIVFFLGYAASVVVFFVFSRYRLPSLPALLPFAGGLIVWLWDAAQRRKGVRNQGSGIGPRHPTPDTQHPRSGVARPALLRVSGGLALFAVGLAPTLYPLHRGSGSWEAAQCLTNLASRYYHDGDTASAVATYEQALKEHPGQAEASRNLGIIAFERRDLVRAEELLTQATRSDRANPVTHHFLGKLYEQRHSLDSAYVEYRQAVNLASGRVEYRFSLATILQKLGQSDAALAQYDTMIELDPNNGEVRHNHSVALYISGQLQKAWDEFETARRLGAAPNPQFEAALRAALQRKE